MKRKLLFIFIIAISLSAILFANSVSEYNREAEKLLKTEMTETEGEYSPMCLFVFADIHGDSKELARYTEFTEKNKKYINDSLCIGDMAVKNSKSDFSFWSEIKGAEKILLALGNHDTVKTEGLQQRKKEAEEKRIKDPYFIYDYTITTEEAHKRYFEPFQKNWNVISPKGANYYYKDYKKEGIRLIVLCATVTGKEFKEQTEWYENTLKDALKNNLAVIVANHYTMCRNTNIIKCAFTRPTSSRKGPERYTEYAEITQDFIDRGGEFIIYLTGHIHRDLFMQNADYPQQFDISIGAATPTRAAGNDIERTKDTKNADLANLCVFDRNRKTFAVIRVGADTTKKNKKRKYMVFDYKNGKIIK